MRSSVISDRLPFGLQQSYEDAFALLKCHIEMVSFHCSVLQELASEVTLNTVHKVRFYL